MPKHHIIYIPGLADKFNRTFGQGVLFGLWRFSNVHPHYFLVGWTKSDETFDHKMKRLTKLVDYLLAKEHTVSIVCSSAGASLALIALFRCPRIHAVVCIAPKLRNPQHVPNLFYKANPAFMNALHELDKIRGKLTTRQRNRILVIKPRVDAVVPLSDMKLASAHVRQLPIRGHLLCIVAALTWYKGVLIKFIKTTPVQK